MRLIDADYLKRMFDVACGTNREVFNIADSVYNFAIKIIDDAPTVEYPEQIIINCDTEEEKQKLLSTLRNARVTIREEGENECKNDT